MPDSSAHTTRPPRVSKRKKLRGFIHKWIFGVYAVATLNELDICYILSIFTSYFPLFSFFFPFPFYWIMYTSRVFHGRHAAYSLRTLLVLRPSRLLTRHQNWSISSTSSLPVLIVSRRYVVTSTLIRLLIRSKAKSLSKRTRYTYLSSFICRSIVILFVFVFFIDWLLGLSSLIDFLSFFFVFT